MNTIASTIVTLVNDFREIVSMSISWATDTVSTFNKGGLSDARTSGHCSVDGVVVSKSNSVTRTMQVTQHLCANFKGYFSSLINTGCRHERCSMYADSPTDLSGEGVSNLV